MSDPDFAAIPLERLLSKPYARSLFEDIRMTPQGSAVHLSPMSGQDTAYAAVTDEAGNAVSFITKPLF
ncbi:MULTISPECIES: gamma-glutamyltransferase [unclassified Paenibacillus]|uniref:gamma-glutamyltransferase n=1 Tax=unclassified Paenibacillus TaxID=185978 RepID=UPI001B589C75|nr:MULTISPECIES: gamma-glutamyltransferase [unclassified Paenibacillus]MBP1155665.1 gamma-glutamyltranspeptidase [Paenibacillus sp. PvP091]MBP1168949.1 gamma-glutamyltranspeptidase [Paenibacillus sp. PvR098]MBP2439977.1 gamma-glutamyltranspeptidase [Paenibacillus sp. PvP052]